MRTRRTNEKGSGTSLCVDRASVSTWPSSTAPSTLTTRTSSSRSANRGPSPAWPSLPTRVLESASLRWAAVPDHRFVCWNLQDPRRLGNARWPSHHQNLGIGGHHALPREEGEGCVEHHREAAPPVGPQHPRCCRRCGRRWPENEGESGINRSLEEESGGYV